MSRSFPLIVFTAVFSVVYIAGFVNGWTLFRYYPLTGEISLQDLPRTSGPAMGWYAWIAQGFVVGLTAALIARIVPSKLAERVWSGFAWFVPFLVVLYTFYFEWHWFQG